MKRYLTLCVWGLVLLIQSACSPAQQTDTLTIFAAASLTDAYEDLATAFEARHEGVNIRFNFAGSSTLAYQITQGAPADIFASANLNQMTIAIDDGRISATPQTFAHNQLVVITPLRNRAGIHNLQDLANEGVNLLVAAEGVPIRNYTDDTLARMAEDSTYGTVYRDSVLGNIVSEEPNVRQVAAKIALGEADAGFVYATDVTPDIADDVQVIAIPDAYTVLATYPLAILSDTQRPELAQAFVDFVLSDQGQRILIAWQFLPATYPEQQTVHTAP